MQISKIRFYILILLLILGVSSCVLYRMNSRPMYNHYIKYQPFDAIIVPGYPHYGDQWDDVVRLRVLWAKYLYDKGIAKNIIFSGSAVYSPYIESRIMKAYAVKLGVDSNHVFTEERAMHSTENVYYSYKLAQQNRWENIALATDYVQVTMVRSFVSKENISIVYLPALINILDSMSAQYKTTPIINDSLAFVPDFVPITEKETPLQRLRGTRGKNIKRDKK